ncbi:MAG: hypothetical protein ACKOW8_05540, partial [Flavobacteriales bacterium]
ISRTVISPLAAITELNCNNQIDNGILITNTPASGVNTIIPYTGGNQGTYSSVSVNSTGVTGLVANLTSGVLLNNLGNLTLNITGTPSAAGIATFELNFAGQTCNFTRNVNAPSGNLGSLDCASADTIIASWDFNNGIPQDWTQNVESANNLAQWEYRGPTTSPGIYVGSGQLCCYCTAHKFEYSRKWFCSIRCKLLGCGCWKLWEFFYWLRPCAFQRISG